MTAPKRRTAEDFYFRVFRNLFAVSDIVLLHKWLNQRRVRHKVNCPKGKRRSPEPCASLFSLLSRVSAAALSKCAGGTFLAADRSGYAARTPNEVPCDDLEALDDVNDLSTDALLSLHGGGADMPRR